MDTTNRRVETQGDLLWSDDGIPTGMLQVLFTLGENEPTLGMLLPAKDAVQIFSHILDHAKQLQADTEMVGGMIKAGVPWEQIRQGTRLTMLKRQAGNG